MLVSIGHEQPDGVLEHILDDLVPGLNPPLGNSSFSLRRVNAAKVLACVAALTAACEARAGRQSMASAWPVRPAPGPSKTSSQTTEPVHWPQEAQHGPNLLGHDQA